jgi:hypothetical protein
MTTETPSSAAPNMTVAVRPFLVKVKIAESAATMEESSEYVQPAVTISSW